MHYTVATKEGGRHVEMTPEEEAEFLAESQKREQEQQTRDQEEVLKKEKEALTREKLILNAGLTPEEADLILMSP